MFRAAAVAVLVLALLAVQATLSVAGQSQLGCTPSTCTLSVARSVTTTNWGLSVTNDTWSFTNVTAPVTYVETGLPLGVVSMLKSITAADQQGSELGVAEQAVNQARGYQAFRINLPASKSAGYSFSVSAVFSGLLKLNATSSTGFVFSFSPFPVVDTSMNVAQATLAVGTSDWPSPTVSGTRGILGADSFTAKATPLNPFNTTIATMSFSATGTSQNLFDVSASRTVTITSSDAVQISDGYNITNRGRQVSSLSLRLADGATSVRGSDLIGLLDSSKVASVTSSNGTVTATITPRFGTIQTNASALVTVMYQVAKGATALAGMPGRYTLAMRVFDNVQFFQPSFETKIVLPSGFRVSEVTGHVPVVSGRQILLQTSNLSPASKLPFTVSYQLDPFWASLAPLSWVGLAEAAVGASVLVYGLGFRGGVAGLAPSGLIGRFVELYDEKSSLRSESDRMEEDLNRGALNRADYKRRRRTLDLRMNEIDRLLSSVKNELSGEQARYADLTKRVERAEAELQVTRSSLGDLRSQYRAGRISRELYESLSSDLLRRRERAQAVIDGVVIGLREEAR